LLNNIENWHIYYNIPFKTTKFTFYKNECFYRYISDNSFIIHIKNNKNNIIIKNKSNKSHITNICLLYLNDKYYVFVSETNGFYSEKDIINNNIKPLILYSEIWKEQYIYIFIDCIICNIIY